jgi:carotenoid 1,2-hydratase
LLAENAAGEAHFWLPIVAVGKVEVELRCGPLELRYRGLAYCDRNYGSGRLEDTFTRWSWAHGTAEPDLSPHPSPESSAELPAGLILYRAERRDGGLTSLSVRYEKAACEEDSTAAAPALLRRGFLWLPVPARFSVGGASSERLAAGSMTDAPFYGRYATRLRDEEGRYLGVGEYLDLDRFRLRAVQRLLTYKTRRVAG